MLITDRLITYGKCTLQTDILKLLVIDTRIKNPTVVMS